MVINIRNKGKHTISLRALFFGERCKKQVKWFKCGGERGGEYTQLEINKAEQ
jgi:hypothetical protein